MTTFDSHEYTHRMHGTFILARDSGESWEINGEFGPCELAETSTCFHGAELKFYFSLRPISIRVGPGDIIAVDNHSVRPPYISESVKVFGRTKIYIRVSHLEIVYEPGIGLTVNTDSTWQGQLVGLCGNFNNNAGDDLMTSSNILTPKLSTFVSSWAKNLEFLFQSQVEQRKCLPLGVLVEVTFPVSKWQTLK